MTSAEMNRRIVEIEADDSLWSDDSGKKFPYIGWFWREVDFDEPTYRFGYIPVGSPEFSVGCGGEIKHGPGTTAQFVGFMENNKWDYPYTRRLTAEEWTECKRLIAVACGEPTEANLRAVWAFVGQFGGAA
jgi:hypothetical protein